MKPPFAQRRLSKATRFHTASTHWRPWECPDCGNLGLGRCYPARQRSRGGVKRGKPRLGRRQNGVAIWVVAVAARRTVSAIARGKSCDRGSLWRLATSQLSRLADAGRLLSDKLVFILA